MENGPFIYFTSMIYHIYLFKIAQVWVLHVHGGDLEMEKAHGGEMERPKHGEIVDETWGKSGKHQELRSDFPKHLCFICFCLEETWLR